MSLFGHATKKYVDKWTNRFENRLDAADADRRRLKGNLDKLGSQVTDLECKLKSLTEGKCNAKKHK